MGRARDTGHDDRSGRYGIFGRDRTMKADEVAHYLQNNPQFFEQYADLMAQIAIPHPHGGRAISITERQMLTLRDKNRQLEAKLGELIGFGEENDAISDKMHRLGVALISAYTFPAVMHTLGYHLKEDFAVPSRRCACGACRPGNARRCRNSPKSARNCGLRRER